MFVSHHLTPSKTWTFCMQVRDFWKQQRPYKAIELVPKMIFCPFSFFAVPKNHTLHLHLLPCYRKIFGRRSEDLKILAELRPKGNDRESWQEITVTRPIMIKFLTSNCLKRWLHGSTTLTNEHTRARTHHLYLYLYLYQNINEHVRPMHQVHSQL